ncbi:MAG: hypothetical protein RL091_572, partial [Verrucomicrobiota bacterium]
MKLPRLALLACLATLFSTALAQTKDNAVLFWNEQVINATRLSRNPPPIAALHLASFHTAIFDTINSFSRTYRGWLVNDPAPEGASLDAAVASS